MQHHENLSVGQMLLQGVSQAFGFVGGALLGRGLGLLFGWDAFAPEGYTGPAMFGIVLIGLGGGAGLQLARRWFNRRYAASESKPES